MMRLADLRTCERVVIDTMVLIYLFEDTPRYGILCQGIFQEIERGGFGGIVTPVTVAELLIKPLSMKRDDIADTYRNALRSINNLDLPPMTFETACLAGALRAKYRLPLPDMIQAAFAVQTRMPAIVTNDKAFRRVTEMRVFLLDDML